MSHSRAMLAAVAEPDLAIVAWRVFLRLGCPDGSDGMREVLAVVLPEHKRRLKVADQQRLTALDPVPVRL